MRGWFESTFGTGALAAQFVVALIVVIVLITVIAAFYLRPVHRQRLGGYPQPGHGPLGKPNPKTTTAPANT